MSKKRKQHVAAVGAHEAIGHLPASLQKVSSHIRIRFRRPYGTYRKGDVISPPASMRTELLRAGIAEPVAESHHESQL